MLQYAFVNFIISFHNIVQILDQGEAFLQSIQTALELIANLCYNEEEDGRMYPQYTFYVHCLYQMRIVMRGGLD